MKQPTCETCVYYHDRGQCRRHAPRPLWLHEIPDDDVMGMATWPVVEPDEWCGEHPDFPAWLQHIRGPAYVNR